MTLRILNVAFPFAPVSTDAVGGAEQILARLDAALVDSGHDSYVIACDGSNTAGHLLSTRYPVGIIEDKDRSAYFAAYRAAIHCALNQWHFDLIHFHGLDFYQYLPDSGIPALITLHLPIEWYPYTIFEIRRPNTFIHCVSYSQHRNCPACSAILPPIINGVPLELCSIRRHKRNFAIALSRIAPEKNLHVALDAARLAKIPILLAGKVFPYSAHWSYYENEIVPRLDRTRRFIGPIGGARKWSLLASARCLLLPSLAAETSSLVALEALACGTPVVAFPSGALPEIIENGKTGFIVQNTEEMAQAIQRVGEIDSQTCRSTVQDRFSLEKMICQYFSVYAQLVPPCKKRAQRSCG